MIAVVCLLVLYNEPNVKEVYHNATGYVYDWQEPEMYVDFEKYFASKGIRRATYMQKVNSNTCSIYIPEEVK